VLLYLNIILTLKEISELYSSKEALKLEYGDSYFGKSLYFDNKSYVEIIDNIDNLNFDYPLSVEMWFKPHEFNGNQTLVAKYDSNYNEVFKVSLKEELMFVELNNSNYSIVVDGIVEGYLNYLFFNYNGTEFNVFVNNYLENYTLYNNNLIPGDNGYLYLGADYNDSTGFNDFYLGEIDELKIYNRSVPFDEILNHFLNYDGMVKGCCNYVTLINYNLLGYNQSAYKENVSSFSRIFYDYFENGIDYNVSLYNISGMTSDTESEKYYNLLVDQCLVRIFNIYDFNISKAEAIPYHEGFDNADCSKLIEKGIY
jgi:hypothetical protein